MKIIMAAITGIGISCCSCAQSPLKITDSFKIKSGGGWDYIALQPNSNRLFVSHGTQVNILDKNNGDSLGVIQNTIGVHGIAFVPSLNKGYISNGKLHNVFVFDLNNFSVKDSIATGKNPDAIFYDGFTKRVITCNGGTKDVSFIDPVTDKVMATVEVGGRPETAVSNGEGKIFVNIEDKNEIAVINTITLKVESRWSLSPGEAPTGLAIDNKTKRLFAACGDNNQLVVLDAETGSVIERFPIGAHCDGAGFDIELKNIYASNGDGSLSVIHEDSKDKFTALTTVITRRGARTIAVDQQTHKLYLPTAEYELQSGQGKPKPVPGTFKVLVVGR